MSKRPERAPTSEDDPSGATASKSVPLVEERVIVEKRDVENVGARIHLRTHEEDVPFSETLRKGHVEVQRVPLGLIVDEPPVSREEDGVFIVPVVEEVLIKRFRIVEELRITSHVELVEMRDTVTLRRQEAIVNDDPDPSLRAPDQSAESGET